MRPGKSDNGRPDAPRRSMHQRSILLVGHETDILRKAGFRDVRTMKQWGESTYTVWAA